MTARAALLLLLALALVPGAQAQTTERWAAWPCVSGTPTPTQCRTVVGSVTSTAAPWVGPTTKTVWCLADIAGVTGAAVSLSAVTINAWGESAAESATVNLDDFAPPAKPGALQILPKRPD